MNTSPSFNEDLYIVFVSHDAARAGSQILLLEIMEWIKEHTRIRFRILLIKGGALLDRFRNLADCMVVEGIKKQDILVDELKRFTGDPISLVYANTVVSGKILEYLQYLDCPIVTHVHELENSIRRFAGTEVMSKTVAYTDKYIAASPQIKDNLVTNHGIDAANIHVINAFIKPQGKPLAEEERIGVRKNLGLPVDKNLVFGCGTLDWRKGPDIFVELASRIKHNSTEKFHFYWIGPGGPGNYIDPGMQKAGVLKTYAQYLNELDVTDKVSFLGEQRNPMMYFQAGDIFVLPSREDPFPLVCLEAANCGLPLVCFDGVGGMPGFVEDDCGFVVPYPQVEQMARKIEQLMKDAMLCRKLGNNAFNKLVERHVVDIAVPEILNIISGSFDYGSSKDSPTTIKQQGLSGLGTLSIDQLMQDAVVHLQGGCYSEAETLYQQVLERQPDHPGALHVLGLIKYQNSDVQTAIELIEKAIAANPDFAEACKNAANIYAELGRINDAIAKYRQAIAIMPDLIEAHVNLGMAYQSQKRLKEARFHFQAALAIDSGLGEAREKLEEINKGKE